MASREWNTTQSPFYIAIIGKVGAGKSTFIHSVIDPLDEFSTSGTLPSTRHLSLYHLALPDGRDVILVDTPGFNGCSVSREGEGVANDSNVLRMLEAFMAGSVERRFSHVILIESVEDAEPLQASRDQPLGKSQQKRALQRIAMGAEVVVVRTNWDDTYNSDDAEYAEERERELLTAESFSKYLMEKFAGAKVLRSGLSADDPVPGYISPRDLVFQLFGASSADVGPEQGGDARFAQIEAQIRAMEVERTGMHAELHAAKAQLVAMTSERDYLKATTSTQAVTIEALQDSLLRLKKEMAEHNLSQPPPSKATAGVDTEELTNSLVERLKDDLYDIMARNLEGLSATMTSGILADVRKLEATVDRTAKDQVAALQQSREHIIDTEKGVAELKSYLEQVLRGSSTTSFVSGERYTISSRHNNLYATVQPGEASECTWVRSEKEGTYGAAYQEWIFDRAPDGTWKIMSTKFRDFYLDLWKPGPTRPDNLRAIAQKHESHSARTWSLLQTPQCRQGEFIIQLSGADVNTGQYALAMVRDSIIVAPAAEVESQRWEVRRAS